MRFEVEVPYLAKITYRVEASSPKEAINKAKQGNWIPGTENDIGEMGESLWKQASATQITMN